MYRCAGSHFLGVFNALIKSYHLYLIFFREQVNLFYLPSSLFEESTDIIHDLCIICNFSSLSVGGSEGLRPVLLIERLRARDLSLICFLYLVFEILSLPRP